MHSTHASACRTSLQHALLCTRLPVACPTPSPSNLQCIPPSLPGFPAGKHGARVMHTFTPQSIANMIWAFATVEQCPDGAFLQV